MQKTNRLCLTETRCKRVLETTAQPTGAVEHDVVVERLVGQPAALK